MKHTFGLAVIALFSAISLGCERNWECTCKLANGDPDELVYIQNATKKEAEELCKDQNSYYIDPVLGDANCSLE